MKKSHNNWKKLLTAASLLSLLFLVQEAQAEAQQYHKGGFYGTVDVSKIINADDSGIRVNLGSGVLQDGEIDYDGNYGAAVAVGYENSFCYKKNPVYLRVEAELFGGNVHRKGVDFGTLHAALDDTVELRALFFNALLGLKDTRHTRWWLGAGAGYAQSQFPDASYATPCGCLKAVTHNGVAFQVKLLAERQISDHAALFAQAGYMRFPGCRTYLIPSVEYSDLNLTNISLGVRTYF